MICIHTYMHNTESLQVNYAGIIIPIMGMREHLRITLAFDIDIN